MEKSIFWQHEATSATALDSNPRPTGSLAQSSSDLSKILQLIFKVFQFGLSPGPSVSPADLGPES